MSASTLPAYSSNSARTSNIIDEKRSTFCSTHGPTDTPQIDSLLHKPNHQTQLLALSKTLADLANSGCTKCATESILRISTDVLTDLQKQKKNGKFTKEQKKALKAEGKMFKAFVKPLRKEMKESFKERK